MAKLYNSIAVFTESILSLESYLLGVIEVNPKELLDQGIRKELLVLIHRILDKALVFQKGGVEDFNKRLVRLAEDLDA
jgi:WASH complex subunit strumpellin